jgi:uncharacterized Zn-binding protein involved in type VI secretion
MNLGIVGSIAPGTCVCTPYPYPDVGVVMSGAPTNMEEGSPVARVGDIVMYSCGTSVIMGGSFYEIEGGMAVSTTGSIVTGCGNGILTGTAIEYITN